MSGAPKARSSPSVGKTRPSSILSSVDLPEPLAPTTATCWPDSTVRSIPDERRPAGAVRVADRAQDEVRRRHGLTIRSAASATAHSATLAVSHSQSPGPIRSRRSDGIAPV